MHFWNALTLLKCSHAHCKKAVTHCWDFSIDGRHLSGNRRHLTGNGRCFASLECKCGLSGGLTEADALLNNILVLAETIRTFSNATSGQLPQEPTHWRANLEHYLHLAAAVVRCSQLLAPSGLLCRDFKLSITSAHGHQAQGEVVEMDIPPALPF